MKTYFSVSILSIILFWLSSLSLLHAQVTVGSEIPPEKASILDLKTKDGGNGQVSSEKGGILFPRVEISALNSLNVFTGISENLNTTEQQQKHKGLTVYNIGTTNVETGIYSWDGAKWQKAGTKKEVNFFYMPSIQIDLSQTPQPINLHTRYMQQFQSPKASSTGTPIPYFSNASDFDYYITDYDDRIFNTVTVNAAGTMTYTLKNPLPADVCCGYINIVFVIK